ncbi:peptide ABC transporter substrate-binding protein [Cellulomonas chitinilytica]|uniref:Peptide ABC transporter substrate-binding protein n=1 Tax=Cellulomonas chitinilytica TaxID=398759 RepID=A0A919P4F3_9CELL|nr:ABC transporter substrate-binding protein [Cellulomonas chitinilytica]GIG21733.1 peptide ABC transporter substrate-binding protein [Cellulomonas chitinilytica]
MSLTSNRRPRRGAFTATTLALTSAFVLAACSAGSGSGSATSSGASGTPQSGGTLTWGVETEPVTLNPQLNGQDKTKLLLRNSYEQLLARQDDGTFVPWLASAYKVSDDELTYTFTVRDGVTFWDGKALDASAVVTNINQQIDPEYNPYGAGGPLSHLASATATDATTVTLVLKEKYAPFLDYIGSLPLISPDAFGKADVQAGGPDVAGTGPFVLESYSKGQSLDFTKNPDYDWAPATATHQGAPYLDALTYRFLPESSVRLGALQSGQVDVIEGVPGTQAAQFQKTDKFTYLTALNTGTPYSLYFNTLASPTSDQKVREAFRDAVDLDAILQSVYAGQRTRAWSAVSPQDPNFYDKSLEGSYGNDVKKANALLDEAGWTGRDADGYRTKDGKRLTISDYQAQPYVRDQRDTLLQAIQAQVKQNAGIDFDVQLVDTGVAGQHQKAKDYGTYDNSNTNPDGVDIEYHWLPNDKGGFINLSNASDPQLLTWLTAAQQTTDVAARSESYSDLQKFVITEKAYSFPLYEPADQIAAQAKVHGVGFRTYYQLPESAYDVWLSR